MCPAQQHISRRLLLVASSLLAWAGAIPAVAQEAADGVTSSDLVRVAKRMYEQLDLRGEMSLAEIETLANWSRRILIYETSLSSEWQAAQLASATMLPDPTKTAASWERSIQDHIQRMTRLENTVRARAEVGTASAGVVTAAQYMRLEAEYLRETLSAIRQSVRERQLDLALPEVEKAKPLGAAKPLIIDLQKDGKVSIGGKPVDDLPEIVRRYAAANPGGSLLVRAAPQGKFARVNEILKACQAFNLPFSLSVLPDK